MADRILKGDSGNDVIIQNNAGSRKIEVTNSGDVEVTGDLKATTVKATNLKANDGTASLEIADSTGDSGFAGNTNLKIKLPSAGGIHESDGSTEVLTESGGSVTLKNTTIDSNVVFPAGGAGNPISVAVIADQKSSGTDGGTFTSGDWRDRDLTTELYDSDGIVSIESDSVSFTLGAGTYQIVVVAPVLMVNNHKIRLYNTTDSSVIATGVSSYADTSATANNAYLSIVFAITGTKSFKIHHRCTTTKSTNGFGAAMAISGSVEIYTTVTISKLK